MLAIQKAKLVENCFLMGLQAPGAPLPIPSLLLSQQKAGPWPCSMLRAGGGYVKTAAAHPLPHQLIHLPVLELGPGSQLGK